MLRDSLGEVLALRGPLDDAGITQQVQPGPEGGDRLRVLVGLSHEMRHVPVGGQRRDRVRAARYGDRVVAHEAIVSARPPAGADGVGPVRDQHRDVPVAWRPVGHPRQAAASQRSPLVDELFPQMLQGLREKPGDVHL